MGGFLEWLSIVQARVLQIAAPEEKNAYEAAKRIGELPIYGSTGSSLDVKPRSSLTCR